MDISGILFALVRNAISGDELSADVISSFDSESLEKLYIVSKKNDIAHIIYLPLYDNGIIKEGTNIYEKFRKQHLTAVYQVSQIEYELNRICDCLEKAKIRYIKLKGSVLRNIYPEKYMRTSCDIDLLVDEENLDKSCESLVKELSYTIKGEKDFHDISLYSKNGVHLELHFNIKENMEKFDVMLEKVWDYSQKKDDKEYEYSFSNEFLLFHIVSHMAYHFLMGGCGVRPIIDLWLLRKTVEYDEQKVYDMLEKCGLVSFYNQAVNLSNVWLNGDKHTEVTEKMENYILGGGTFGSVKNYVSVNKETKGGGGRYILSRIFVPLSSLKKRYPVLKRFPFLLPAFEVVRWVEMLFSGRTSHSRTELKNALNNGENSAFELMKELELK